MKKSLLAIILSASMLMTTSAQVLAGTKNIELTPIFPNVVGDTSEYGYAKSNIDMSYIDEQAENMPQAYAVLPEKFDLRNVDGKSYVTPVGDQKKFGTCWTFGAMTSLESSLLMKEQPTELLSRRNLAYFTYNGTKADNGTNGDGWKIPGTDAYNSGGFGFMSTSTLSRWNGAVTNAKAPYDGIPIIEGQENPDGTYVPDEKKDAEFMEPLRGQHDAAILEEVVCIPMQTPEILKQRLMQNGAIAVGYASDEQYYNDMKSTDATKPVAFYCDKKSHANHEVTIIGWDDNFSRENFNNKNALPKENGAWLIQNSWGDQWGDNGSFWISYEDQTMEDPYQFSGDINADKVLTNYQYDGLGRCNDMGLAAETAYYSNIFTAKDSEYLESVSFYTADMNAKYSIQVYTNVTDPAVPSSGKKAWNEPQSGVEQLPGYHTVLLDSAPKLKAGEKFAVVIEAFREGDATKIPVEYILANEENKPMTEIAMDRGQSFVGLLADGEITWMDMIDYSEIDPLVGNVCVKAFTNPRKVEQAQIDTLTAEFLGDADVSLGKQTMDLTLKALPELVLPEKTKTVKFSVTGTGDITINDKTVTVGTPLTLTLADITAGLTIKAETVDNQTEVKLNVKETKPASSQVSSANSSTPSSSAVASSVPTTNAPTTTPPTNVVKTSDNTPIVMVIVLGVFGLLTAAVMIKKRNK